MSGLSKDEFCSSGRSHAKNQPHIHGQDMSNGLAQAKEKGFCVNSAVGALH